jgi:integrase
MYAWGIEQGHVKTNPFAGVKLTAAPKRERFLTRAEAAHFVATIDLMVSENAVNSKKGVNPTFGDALKLLLLTGARKTEILGLRAGEVDLGRRQLVLPPERTKAGGSTGTRRIILSAEAAAILAKRIADEAPADAFVFPAARGDGHAMGLRRAFAAVVKRAKLGELRVHDLRHTAASLAIADGASLFLVSKILGHASARTSERYAHLSADPLVEAVDRIGKSLIPEPGRHNEAATSSAIA